MLGLDLFISKVEGGEIALANCKRACTTSILGLCSPII
jgi:hypothetical protein